MPQPKAPDGALPSAAPSQLRRATVESGALASALKPAQPKRRSKTTCVVELSSEGPSLLLEEARHGLFAETIAAEGDLGSGVQVDGQLLARMAGSFPPATVLQLTVTDAAVEVRAGSFVGRLTRLEKTAARVARKPMPKNKKHKGKVEPRLEGRHLRPRGDTWDFSAAVPFKADRRDGDQEDES